MGEIITFPKRQCSGFPPAISRSFGELLQVFLGEAHDGFPLVAEILGEHESEIGERVDKLRADGGDDAVRGLLLELENDGRRSARTGGLRHGSDGAGRDRVGRVDRGPAGGCGRLVEKQSCTCKAGRSGPVSAAQRP